MNIISNVSVIKEFSAAALYTDLKCHPLYEDSDAINNLPGFLGILKCELPQDPEWGRGGSVQNGTHIHHTFYIKVTVLDLVVSDSNKLILKGKEVSANR